MKIYNSLSRKIEEFQPIVPTKVGVYTCGPTVYDYLTIGNWRTYTLGDLLVRTLTFFGYQVTYVMNITDVGHLTGDNLGDADMGDDRMENSAKREGKTAWEVAAFYTNDFLESFSKLNLTQPERFSKATDHIQEQIDLVQAIEKRGFVYRIDDGVYFDTAAYEAVGNRYGELSTLDAIKEGARVQPNPRKKNPRDFALWKFSPERSRRDMEWPSPWGKGFPGWHIECSAMSMKYLGDQFDVHVGGEDLKSTHHPNEIAQSEAATGKKPFVKYWVHGAFLLVDGGRMGKSKGNAYTLLDVTERGFDPMALRYFYFTGHYRSPQNFTWEGLGAAANALNRLRMSVSSFRKAKERSSLSREKLGKLEEYRQRFKAALENDLSVPEALSVVWEVVKSNIPDYDKYDLLLAFDQVLGLKLNEVSEAYGLQEIDLSSLPEDIGKEIQSREDLRKQGKFAEADIVRKRLEEKGFIVEDTPGRTVVKKSVDQ
ncbi:MAG: cysteine--tRNA ligase [Candidatus Chisholmbacteria bacterium RIFCSPHIGHO2_01_FULL_49_18]|uniref:Cysteine--tRNA ligase n=2 Tax=Candidatus Chisholmiibacteriota TaxID=1817900 RepID=A0A1G1VLK2_9BACT|nr:MAG: cysteine--tRNA ligase [Candidatus Chisholmbacteria bacterium RIFCSPHIGHO2_01_FULL_49_18]OGY21804.1 MAG: cysteine--tRNA ligase [Candidatus Chisholmbacteria bacterium RIFCSPLOWO2_01_FULL_49_14]